MQHHRVIVFLPILVCLVLMADSVNSLAQEPVFDQAVNSLYIDNDPQTALEFFNQAALSCDPRAMFHLGLMHMEGQGTPIDVSKGLNWLKKSALAGDPHAQNQLGIYHIEGSHGVAKNPQQAFQYLAQAVNQNHCVAALVLAGVHASGIETPKNPQVSAQWIAKAEQLGCAKPGSSALMAPYEPTPADIAGVQRGLASLGYNPGPVDGLYGPRTAQAIRSFQSQQGMIADGAVTPQLIQRLNYVLSNR